MMHFSPKGFPPQSGSLDLRRVAQHGWNVLRGDLPTPVAVLKQTPLRNNIAWMKRFCDRWGLSLAPHGKTTLSPELYRLQLDAGAWGITFANVFQAGLGFANGVPNLLIANQVFQPIDLATLHGWQQQKPEARALFLVDSQQQLGLIRDWLQRHPQASFEVLLELGVANKRAGVRDDAQALALAREIHRTPGLRLVGIEAYEGGLLAPDEAQEQAAVGHLMARIAQVAKACEQEGLFETEEIILTAGGSTLFDLVALLLKPTLVEPHRKILRSGCYLTHDHLHLERQFERLIQRTPSEGRLQPALELVCHVASTPEPGLAILNLGRRDVAFDQAWPKPLQRLRAAASPSRTHHPPVPQAVPAHWAIDNLNDQHAYLRYDPQAGDPAPEVGELLLCGFSHPCTTFDKWRWMPIVDDAYTVVDAVTIHF